MEVNKTIIRKVNTHKSKYTWYSRKVYRSYKTTKFSFKIWRCPNNYFGWVNHTVLLTCCWKLKNVSELSKDTIVLNRKLILAACEKYHLMCIGPYLHYIFCNYSSLYWTIFSLHSLQFGKKRKLTWRKKLLLFYFLWWFYFPPQ